MQSGRSWTRGRIPAFFESRCGTPARMSFCSVSLFDWARTFKGRDGGDSAVDSERHGRAVLREISKSEVPARQYFGTRQDYPFAVPAAFSHRMASRYQPPSRPSDGRLSVHSPFGVRADRPVR